MVQKKRGVSSLKSLCLVAAERGLGLGARQVQAATSTGMATNLEMLENKCGHLHRILLLHVRVAMFIQFSQAHKSYTCTFPCRWQPCTFRTP